MESQDADHHFGASRDFGINELIGFWKVGIMGQFASRVYNVDLTNKILNWTVVEPGESFHLIRHWAMLILVWGIEAYIIKDGATTGCRWRVAKQVAPYLEHCSMLA